MPAHLYPTRYIMILLSLLTVSSLPLMGTGCSSSEPTEYRQFSETIDERSQKTDADSETEQAAGSKTTITNQTPPPENETTAPAKQTTTSPEKTANHTPSVPTKKTTDKVANNPEPVKQIDTQVGEEAAPLVAKKPDPKDRALSEQEQKELVSLEPREVKILVKERIFRKTTPENALLINYDDIDLLKVMNMEPVTPEAPELMPQWLKDLDGKRIRIRGFMYPPFQQTGNEVFQLARDNQICCFGKNPKIYDLFPVIMRDGVTADYILNRPFDVVGVFHIKAETIDGELERIYLIDDAIVIDK
ncbi:hypothetical protein Pan241w_03170 [Gimesia alba]|uniref:DUF3299 domain-containing protein n=1 Tax=Gimesia alba TaxID=2527973 RepID=A0A517R8T1_9PLAN|nr:hypothetical protein [Gimesia alba]QDT40261.1 hypothetical protein Pan241w_03170 [Gimesia alba]